MSLLPTRGWCRRCCVQSSLYKHPNAWRDSSFCMKDRGQTRLQSPPYEIAKKLEDHWLTSPTVAMERRMSLFILCVENDSPPCNALCTLFLLESHASLFSEIAHMSIGAWSVWVYEHTSIGDAAIYRVQGSRLSLLSRVSVGDTDVIVVC